MGLGIFSSLFGGKNEPFVSIDIGTSTIKVVCLDMSGSKPKLLSAGSALTPADAISNNAITDPEKIAEVIRSIVQANEIEGTKVAFSIPGPAVFTKKITIAYCEPEELDNTIEFEASNYIPHSVDSVHLDYQVLSVNDTSTMDILLVAVKNEIIDSYVTAIEEAELEPAIADVDYFAFENMFETNYPQKDPRAIALINIGARYTSVSIVEGGESLFTGDVGVGGRLYTDALCESLSMQPAEAERAKMGMAVEGYDANLISETLDRTTEHIASEIHRQLGFFWNAAATERSIEAIYLCGGGVQSAGLIEELSGRTGMGCTVIEPFRAIDWSANFDEDYIDEIKLSMGVGVGLALRRFGDKQNATA